MLKIVAKCGIDCETCPWSSYSRKDITAEEFEEYRKNSKIILGYMPIKTTCVTCHTPDYKIPKGSQIPNRRCLIRQCVDRMEVVNCAYCSRFPCDTTKATGGIWNKESIEKKLGAPISDQEHHTFVEPFEGINRLEAIRASLKPEEVIEPTNIQEFELKIIDFPENLQYSRKK